MRHKLPTLFLALCLLISPLTGCEKSTQHKSNFPSVTKKFSKNTTLTGTVSAKNQWITTGSVKATDSKGQQVGSTELNNSNRYKIEIPAGTELPIVLTFSPDPTSEFKELLVSAVVIPNLTTYDLNPFTTAIAQKAQTLGGYTHENMLVAAESSVHLPDENKTSGGWRGDPTKQYGGWH